MKKNVGTTDRVIRIVIALVLFSLILFIDGPWRWIGLVGLVPLLTAFVSFCPIYRIFGVSTCKIAD